MKRPIFLTKYSFTDHVQGVSWYILCCFVSSTLTILYKCTTEVANPFQIMFVVGIFSFCCFIPTIVKTHGRILITRNKKSDITIGALTFLVTYTWIIALSIIPAPEVTAVKFLAPILVTLLAIILLHESVSYQKWISVFLGFVGMLIIIRPGYTNMGLAYLILIGSNFIHAIRDIILKAIAREQLASTIVIYNTIAAVLLSAPFACCDYQELGWNTLFVLAIMGILSNVFYLTKIKAFNKTDLSVVQPLDFLKLLFTSILAYLILNEEVNIYTFIGGALIISGTYYTIIYERRRRNRRKIEKNKKAIITHKI